MLASFLIVFVLPFAYAKISCNSQVTLKEEFLTTGGVRFAKLVVDGSNPIEVTFANSNQVPIKKIKWKLNGGPIDVDEDETKSPVYWKNEQSLARLVIQHPKQHYIGDWEMTLIPEDGSTDIVEECQLTSSQPMIHRFTETFRATEGYPLAAVCKSASVPAPTAVQWFRAENSGDNVVLVPVSSTNTTIIEGDTLFFDAIKKVDTGVYICNTTGSQPFDSAVAEVKVKSRFAALWPFIGILAELIILLITIIIYERHKSSKKRRAAESDPLLSVGVNPGGDLKSSSGKRYTKD